MIQGAIRAFQLDVSETEDATKPPEDSNPNVPVSADVNPPSQATPARGGLPTTEAPPPMLANPTADASTVDMDWNIDFSAMDMEAFLSIDMSQEFSFGV
ncbi:hypothetical protein IMZ48_38390 [Candidatus Bathyarchaeota archaeon]|nr:hypothetical protein [Candidatus Bathyarchaeota archaeon]